MDIQPSPASCPDGPSALNSYDIQDEAENGLDFYSPASPAYSQWKTLELVDWSTFMGRDNLADSSGQHISQSNEILASPDWEARGHLDAHIPIAGAHKSSQDIDQAAFNWPSLSPSASHTFTRPQAPAKKAVRKRKTSSEVIEKKDRADKRAQERNRVAASKFRYRRYRGEKRDPIH
ncbi:hypothetical protein FOTG_16315 [Fusarium oxysporum f. sp. vasinfectum 25433]|uniref:BZIP domain-containing protein n=1 Tax=Fusarium oxysporum f. sp. vasinfectum 25433 TaxID=1089449 RepID=X0KP77_FUSOX|nr:hypothetical protein FOTG_16315 [Fusarium oxysporum f. sp. vasinfectum 25433]